MWRIASSTPLVSVALPYEQHEGVPGSCFGETEYFVTGVRPLGP
jgi:hypothetical protein